MNINFGAQSDQKNGYNRESSDKTNSIDETISKKFSKQKKVIVELTSLQATKISQNVQLVPVNSNLNKVSDDHFREIAREKGMNTTEIDKHLIYIKNHYKKWKLEDQNIRIKKLGKEGLVRTIEFLADTGTVVTHFKRKILDSSGRIVKGAPLGEGQFAVVKLSIINMSAKLQRSAWVADKALKDPSFAQNTIEEGNINKKFDSSSNVRRCYRINDKGLLLEGMKGNLKTHKILNATEMFKIVKDIITGVTEIHQKGFVHQDLHKENILVSYDDVWKIGDLGSAQEVKRINTKPIHLAIASPNLIRSYAFNINLRTNTAEDVWALGIMFYELENGNLPIFATLKSCQPLVHAVKELNNCRKQIQSLDDEDLKYLIFSGKRNLEIPDSNLQKDEIIALSKSYIELRNQVREKFQARYATIRIFCQDYQPKSEFGDLIKKMLNPDETNRISLKDVKEIIEKIDSEQITKMPILNTVESHKTNDLLIDFKSLNLASTSSEDEISDSGDEISDSNDVYDDPQQLTDNTYDKPQGVSRYTTASMDIMGWSLTDDQHLVQAVNSFDIEFLKARLSKGYDIPGWRDSNNETLLHTAIKKFRKREDSISFIAYQKRSFLFINFLLTLGMDVNAKDVDGNTALHFASSTLSPNIILLLLVHSANPNAQNNLNEVPLHDAVRRGSSKVCHILSSNGAYLDLQDNFGNTALTLAVEKSNIEFLQAIMNKGYNFVGWRNSNNETLLHIAIKNLIDQEDSDMITPFGLKESFNTINFLLNLGVEIDAKNDDGNTALHFASNTLNEGIILLLLKHGANPNAQNKQDEAPLHHAVRKGSAKVCLILNNNGAKLDIHDKQGNTPLSLGEENFVFLDENKLLLANFKKDDPNSTKMDPNYVEWYKNQAILTEFLNATPGVTKEAIKMLELLSLQAYSKAASLNPKRGDEGRIKMQLSPLFGNSRYHRSSSRNEFLEMAEKAKFGEIKDFHKFIVDSPLFIDVLARNYKVSDILSIKSADDIIALSSRVKGNRSYKMIIDYSNFDLNELENCLYSNGLGYHKGIILLGIKGVPGDLALEIPLWWGGNESIKYEDIFSLLRYNGFLPSPDQTKQILLKYRLLNSVMREADVNNNYNVALVHCKQSDNILETPLAKLETNKVKTNDIQLGFEGLLNRNAVKKFKEICTNSSLPYVKILAEGTCLLLEGLADRPVDQAFADEGLNELLPFTYHKIIDAIASATLYQNEMATYIAQIEIIHQEIQNILAILSIKHPYPPHEFGKSLAMTLTSGALPIIPKLLGDPSVCLKPSGMRCVSSVLSSIEAEKGSRDLGMVILKDSYYEISRMLNETSTYSQIILDGDGFLTGGINSSLSEIPANKSIDIFICEFHHNISDTRREYHRENIVAQLLAMNNSGYLADKCTLMVDATLDLELSQNMYEVFNNTFIQKLISTGRLNVVFLRSAQKMDMFGMDNYYGGITITVNNRDKSYKNFNNRMEQPSDQLNGLSYQGMTHLQKYSKDVRDSYRKVIMRNTSYLFNNLPPKMIAQPSNFNPIQVSLKNDDKLVYLDIKAQIGGHDFEGVLQATLLEFGIKNKLLVTSRPSYGFYNLNVTSLPNKFRLCPGLEEVSQLNSYIELMNYWQICVEHTMKNCWDDKMSDGERVQKLKDVISYNFLERYINNK